MFSRRVGNTPSWLARRCPPVLLAGLFLAGAVPAWGQTPLPPVTVGAGLRTTVGSTAPDGGDSTTSITLDSARLYIAGPVTDKISFMFNTEYNGSTQAIGVMDAAARIAVSPQVNLWFGRFLPPSDRANLYGPFYSNAALPYTDGVQDGFPAVAVGRDNGVMYWGQFGKVKLAAGAFDGTSLTGNSELLTAARVMVDFWDPEGGYYLNGTYY
ncbi:MAG: hypothetical protein ABI652_05990, partial [Acidobacteriota bacterium]